ncbi:DUF6223 family protein [Nonomuraea dietziae]|uniref:DUF6223 family protein n=1 Tax=Nonomuraea dietziae TaxID=65515 RepID=UPI0031CF11AA
MPVRFLLVVAGAALIGGFGLAAPAAAQVLVQPDPAGAYAMTSGRLWSLVAALLGLAGAVIGGLALARPASRLGIGTGRGGAMMALAAGAGRRGRRRAGRRRRRGWSRHRLRNSRGLPGPGSRADRHGPRRAGPDPRPPHRLTRMRAGRMGRGLERPGGAPVEQPDSPTARVEVTGMAAGLERVGRQSMQERANRSR